MTTEDRFTKIDKKLDKLVDSIHSIDKTLVKQEAHLKEHIRRTELAEENIQAIRDELKPVKAHVNRVEGALKLVGLVSVLVTIAAGVIKILALI